MKHGTLFIFLFCLLLGGCEKADDFTADPRTNFNALWKIMDEHYCFFDYKGVDWDEVYDRYVGRVDTVKDQFELFQLLGEMLAEVKDGHTNLISSFDVARYWDWYEKYARNYDKTVHDSYLGTGTEYRKAGGLLYKRFAGYTIAYIYYESFQYGVSENNLDYVLLYFKDCKGLIIDVRENGGGSLTYSDRIASRFIENKMLTGYIQHKTGTGHNDFSEPYPLELSPSDRVRWLRPVVVITNRHCYSATNDFVYKMSLLSNVTLLGDRTGGGSGFPFSSELPIGWSVRFSASPLLDIHKNHIESGIDPDVFVNMTSSDIAKGVDPLIDHSVSLLLEK